MSAPDMPAPVGPVAGWGPVRVPRQRCGYVHRLASASVTSSTKATVLAPAVAGSRRGGTPTPSWSTSGRTTPACATTSPNRSRELRTTTRIMHVVDAIGPGQAHLVAEDHPPPDVRRQALHGRGLERRRSTRSPSERDDQFFTWDWPTDDVRTRGPVRSGTTSTRAAAGYQRTQRPAWPYEVTAALGRGSDDRLTRGAADGDGRHPRDELVPIGPRARPRHPRSTSRARLGGRPDGRRSTCPAWSTRTTPPRWRRTSTAAAPEATAATSPCSTRVSPTSDDTSFGQLHVRAPTAARSRSRR